MFFAYTIAYSFIRGICLFREQKVLLEKENIDAQLKQLHAQIEPHFIFNTLNTIYALAIEEKAKKTSLCIEELSDLFRYSFRENACKQNRFAEELSFIEKFIHLNEIRFSNNENSKVITQIEWDKKPAQIAPMLLINFIENAFKYSSLKENSSISIFLSIVEKKLSMIVKNTIKTNKELLQNGIGLSNTKKRLDMVYRNNYTLQHTENDNVHVASLQINLV
jgi:sensor histidine kinase YesM